MDVIEIKSFIDCRPLSFYQWLLVGLFFLVVVADGMDVAIMGFLAPSLLHAWGISRPVFGLVMSAAPFGLVFGALAAGAAADRFGRRIVLIGALFCFGLFTLLAAAAGTPTQLASLRFLAGIGMGAAMPSALTLLSEYAPERRRSLMINIMFTGFNLGSGMIGFIAGGLVPWFGWRSVLVVGGALPLLLVPLLVLLVPESARLLVARAAPPARIASALRRVTRARLSGAEHFISAEPALPARSPVGLLFSASYRLRTLGLWITCFMGLLVIYLFTGWLPTLLRDAGASIVRASSFTALFQIGGTLGAIAVGWAMDRTSPAPTVAAAYLGGALCISCLGAAGIGAASFAPLVFASGFCMSGAQTGLNAFVPGRYPTAARATGVSWMLGVGRFGSIVGSAFGGVLLGSGLPGGAILGLLAIPAALAAAAMFTTQAVRSDVTSHARPALH